MNQEYVKMTDSEKIFGAKSLLHSQVSLLNSVKHIQEYNRLRNEELAIKILLKKKLAEFDDGLKVLEKVMPKMAKEKEEEEVRKDSVKKRMSLESELEEIRRKIEKLK